MRGWIEVGRDQVSLEQLADLIGGRAAKRIIYFGSCSTLDVDGAELADFCKRSGAKALVGYTEDVGWLEAAAFDFLLLP